MRRIVIANFKGGVGKTACATNLSQALARAGRRTLLVDTDVSGNASVGFGVDREELPGLYELIMRGPGSSNPRTQQPEVVIDDVKHALEDKLDLVPASSAMGMIDSYLHQQSPRAKVLAKRLSRLAGYDFVIMDTAPSFSLMAINAFYWANEVWVPCSMEFYALEGVRQIQETLDELSDELGKSMGVTYVIPTIYDPRNSKSKDVCYALEDEYGDRVLRRIRTDVKVSEAPSYQKTVLDHAPTSRGAMDYTMLAERIVANGPR